MPILLSSTYFVALHPEGVDRNESAVALLGDRAAVALHPEGVDRNKVSGYVPVCNSVALHPEGVDRNALVDDNGNATCCRPPPGGRG